MAKKEGACMGFVIALIVGCLVAYYVYPSFDFDDALALLFFVFAALIIGLLSIIGAIIGWIFGWILE